MKLFLSIALVFASSFSLLFGQVAEAEKTMSQGTKNALTLEIKNVTVKSVEKEWKRYIKEFKKDDDKYDKKSKEFRVMKAKLPLISGDVNTVDIYVVFMETSSGSVNATFWYDLGGIYLNSKDHADKFREASAWMKKFATQAEQTVMKEKLEEETDRLKEVEKKLRKLVSTKEDLLKDIENYKEKIKKAESDISNNVKDQELTKKAIEEAQKNVEAAKKRVDQVKY
jgi:myosin heavy subunit